MGIRIKRNAAENTVEIDGTKFDLPADKDRKDGIRELVVNHYCKKHGFPVLYPDATDNAK